MVTVTCSQLSPDAVPENSRAGTVVGCLQGQDDDPGQVLSFFIVKSINRLFELFRDERNHTCVRVRMSFNMDIEDAF